VTRSALQNAASIAGMVLTTECIVVDMPEPKEGAPPQALAWAATSTTKAAALHSKWPDGGKAFGAEVFQRHWQ
jgi:hypothetical protein